MKASNIGRTLGKIAAKHNAIIKYTAINGVGVVGFKPKKKAKFSYEFANEMEEEVAPRGWECGMWTDTFGEQMFTFYNHQCHFTKDKEEK